MKIKFKPKILIIVLIILIVVGWALAIYFFSKSRAPVFTCDERLEKLHSYALLLDRSNKLVRQDKSLDVLEADIRLLDNGSLFNTWQDAVFGGNQKRDVEYYFDVIIDSLKFFSE